MTGPETPAGQFRRVVGRFATGVTVVTTRSEGVPHGMTVNAFASVSLDPLLILVCVDRAASLHPLLTATKTFAVTVLEAGQEEESIFFASPQRPAGPDQFTPVAWHDAPVTGSPVLSAGLAYLDCRVVDVLPGGDHSVFLGEVVGADTLRDGDPLVFYESRYRRLSVE